MIKARAVWALLAIAAIVLGSADVCMARRSQQVVRPARDSDKNAAKPAKDSCTYVAFKGLIKIVSITPKDSEENVKKDEQEVRFVFEPLFPQGNPTVKISGEPFVMMLRGDVYPTKNYIEKNKITVGSTYNAVLKALQQGADTCAQSMFDYPDFSR